MPRTINILSPTLASKIAAGEVVQRPASAVKELIENALDACATSITVIVKDAGKTLIHVMDDGSGMSAEDAVLAFERHATSKIATYEDLEAIRTLGFRGEALASIASISQIELRTRQAASDVGTRVRVDGGIPIETGEDAPPPGTQIIVRNLFYNTPGRRNFLKSNSTEFKHIFDVVQRFAMSKPGIQFQFTSDDEIILDLRPGTWEERIKEIFGEKLSQTLFYFEHEAEHAKIRGFLGKPDFARKTRAEQYLFLNNRSIINRSINHAVFQAYEHMLEKGSFPVFVLALDVDPHHVDVNVHPSKMEVKFEDESSIYRFVLHAVRHALSSHDLIPQVGMREESPVRNDFALRFQTTQGGTRVANWEELIEGESGGAKAPFKPAAPAESSVPSRETNLPVTSGTDERTLPAGHVQPAFIPPPNDTAATSETPVWQIHNKYLLIPIPNGVMLIDQHAAHERVLYERVLDRMARRETASQQLLFPITSEMTAGDAALVQQLNELLTGFGFGIKLFGKTTVIIDSIPSDVKPGDESTILQRVLDSFKEDEHQVKMETRERLAKVYACKAAIKKGDPLNQSEMRSLLDQLFKTAIPYVCPHGRPVIVKLSLDELDRRFGRTS